MKNNLKLKIVNLNITINRKNMIYIKKFNQFLNIAQYINFCQIFYNNYINDFTIILKIKFNLLILIFLKVIN